MDGKGCKTCNDTGRIPKPLPEIPHPCTDVNFMRANRTITCPDCKPKAKSNAEFVERLQSPETRRMKMYEIAESIEPKTIIIGGERVAVIGISPIVKAIKIISLDGEPAIAVFGKTENDVENFAKHIAGLFEASVGLHYEVAIKLLTEARKKWLILEPKKSDKSNSLQPNSFADATDFAATLQIDAEESSEPDPQPDAS